MAESLALLGLTCNTLQLMEHGYKALAFGKEVYVSGPESSQIARDIRLLLEDISNTAQEVQSEPPNLLSPDEKAIQGYSRECSEVAAKLLEFLASIQPRDKVLSQRLEKLRIASKMTVRRSEVAKLEQRLRDLDDRLRNRLLRLFQVKNYSSVMSGIGEIQDQAEGIRTELSENLRTLQGSVTTRLKNAECGLSDLRNSLDDFMKQTQQSAEARRFLESLCFPEITKRVSSIDEAHKSTFKWVFQEGASSKLASWLRGESSSSTTCTDQIFWVTGHAGSGKSTLMKYITEESTTSELLKEWTAAPGSVITIARFYFWMQGLPMERSQQGLLQSLLFQVFRRNIDLIPLLCPDRDHISPWTVSELAAVLGRLVTHNFKEKYFCFFIDGLDEYEGDEDEIIGIISKLAQCPNIKLCISSRPWSAFRRAFGACPHLSMQGLNHDDIEAYIRAELTENARFAACVAADSRFETTFEHLTGLSKGVWLWVVLVVRGLKRDLQLGEAYEHWEERIKHIPTTLEDFFHTQLTRLDPFYRLQTARTFLTMLFKLERIPGSLFTLEEYRYLIQEVIKPDYWKTVQSLDCDGWTETELIQHLADEYKRKLSTMQHIESRCRDLIVVQSDYKVTQGKLFKAGFEELKIEFLHRTVRDFFQNSYLDTLKKDAGPSFRPAVSVARATIVMMKSRPPEGFINARKPVIQQALSSGTVRMAFPYHSPSFIVHDFVSNLHALGEEETDCEFVDEFDSAACRWMESGKNWVLRYEFRNDSSRHISGWFGTPHRQEPQQRGGNSTEDDGDDDPPIISVADPRDMEAVRVMSWCLRPQTFWYITRRWHRHHPDLYSAFTRAGLSPIGLALSRFSNGLDGFTILCWLLTHAGGSPNEPHRHMARTGRVVLGAGYACLNDILTADENKSASGELPMSTSWSQFKVRKPSILPVFQILFVFGLYLPTPHELAELFVAGGDDDDDGDSLAESRLGWVTRESFVDMAERGGVCGRAEAEALLEVHNKLLGEGKTDGPARWKEYIEIRTRGKGERKKEKGKAKQKLEEKITEVGG
ncbi:hypothetical protein QBC44DRAFT_314527 [Cladorrhinum sp. PSN332]|nr:hypothetical protein QBC44DRAFT_314527 [Cladorrhinum sp. PSN332]